MKKFTYLLQMLVELRERESNNLSNAEFQELESLINKVIEDEKK